MSASSLAETDGDHIPACCDNILPSTHANALFILPAPLFSSEEMLKQISSVHQRCLSPANNRPFANSVCSELILFSLSICCPLTAGGPRAYALMHEQHGRSGVSSVCVCVCMCVCV